MHMTVKRSGSTTLLAAAFILASAGASAEVFVDVGVSSTQVEADIAITSTPSTVTSTQSGVHVGAGVRRALQRGSIGARIELDDGDWLLAVRAFDWERHLTERIAVGAFLGAARLDLATPAYGYYLGGGVRLREVLAGWDLGIDLRLGDKIARDNVLPTDPQGRPDNFYDLTGISVYLSRRF
jgi:hypothetical protein